MSGFYDATGKLSRPNSSMQSIQSTFKINDSIMDKDSIAELEKEQDMSEKINLNSRNLFNTLSLPNDLISSLNYSNNFISKIEKLSHLKHLVYLDLSDNHVEELIGLPHGLCVLLLSKNRLTKISNLQNLVNLNVLDLSMNSISEIEGLESCQNLGLLNLESNLITKVPELGFLTSLIELNLKKNKVFAQLITHRKIDQGHSKTGLCQFKEAFSKL